MKKVLFVDFEDSFTYNVVQELCETGLHVDTIHWMDLGETHEADLLVAGPGPGHPDDYQRVFPFLRAWIEQKKDFFGVCLGHQIFWRLLGESVVRSKEPLHGQKIPLTLDRGWQEYLKLPFEVEVQRYNSLCVPGQAALQNPLYQNVLYQEEIMATRGPHVLTYQFHPESVGTSFRRAFFMPLQRLPL